MDSQTRVNWKHTAAADAADFSAANLGWMLDDLHFYQLWKGWIYLIEIL